MSDLSNQLFNTKQIRDVEQRTIDDLGIPGYTLMTRAGKAVVNILQDELSRDDQLLVLCGPGNNGGDGYVVAAMMKSAGHPVTVISVSDPDKLTGDAALAYDEWIQTGGVNQSFNDQLPDADVIIDALFGIGLERDLAGEYLGLVKAANEMSVPKLAIDIPSGLCSETGSLRGTSIDASMTVTFIGLKLGLLLQDGPDYAGNVVLDDLDVPVEAYPPAKDTVKLLDDQDIARRLTPRRKNSHKGDYGHVCLVGGGKGMPGAVLMAGEAAVRSGAGLVSVVTHEAHAAALTAACPVLMMHGADNSAALRELSHRATVIAIGPGLGQDSWARELFAEAMEGSLPVVIDADALNLMAHNPRQSDMQLLTPHPGEAARLLGMTTAAIQSDRLDAIRQLHQRYGGVIILKGQGTLIHDGEQTVLCSQGNPGMASGGMGDLLTGIVAALIAQGLALMDAAIVGVQVHARCGDAAAGQHPRGLIATDLLPYLREMLNP